MKLNRLLNYALFVTVGVMFFLCSCGKDNDTSSMCSDGIRNQDETGVDCGGVCPDCPLQEPKSEYYFKGHLDGQYVLLEATGFFVADAATSSSNGSNSCTHGYGASIDNIANLNDDTPIVYIDFEHAFSANTNCNAAQGLANAQFASHFEPGTFEYLPEGISGGTPPARIVIKYVDANVKSWYSNEGIQPASSTFEVTDNVSVPRPAFTDRAQKVSGTFSCILYDRDGNSIKAEDCSFVYRFLR